MSADVARTRLSQLPTYQVLRGRLLGYNWYCLMEDLLKMKGFPIDALTWPGPKLYIQWSLNTGGRLVETCPYCGEVAIRYGTVYVHDGSCEGYNDCEYVTATRWCRADGEIVQSTAREEPKRLPE